MATPTLAVMASDCPALAGHAPVQGFHDFIGHELGPVGRRLRKEQRKLVAPQPRQNIGLPRALFQQPGNALEEIVAGLVAETIVDVLEMIEIDDEDSSGSSVPRRSFNFPSQFPFEPPPVVETRQEVVIDEILELPRPLLALGNILYLVDDIERAAVRIANDRYGEQHPDEVAPGMAIALLDLVAGNLPREQGVHLVGSELDIFRMGDGLKGGGLQLVGRKTGDSAKGAVDLKPAALHVH